MQQKTRKGLHYWKCKLVSVPKMEDGEDALSADSSLSRQKGKEIFRSAHHTETRQTHHNDYRPEPIKRQKKKRLDCLSFNNNTK